LPYGPGIFSVKNIKLRRYFVQNRRKSANKQRRHILIRKREIMPGAAAFALASWTCIAGASELTVVGAERAANKDGSIPALSATMDRPTPGWSPGKSRLEHWRYKDEKPQFVIDASNVDKYANKLSAGQIELIKTIKGYSMPIYPTHRSCVMPDFVQNNTKANISKAKIADDGWSLDTAALPGVPFPQPKSGIEAIWNHLTRYTGFAVDMPSGASFISPAPGQSEGVWISWQQLFYFPWGNSKVTSSPDAEGRLSSGAYYAYREPAALAGQAVNSRAYFGKDGETFYYFPGQRRVRRLPTYAYDAPFIGFENQYTVDMTFIFSGNPDRFDWKIVGKKELYVPYNNVRLMDPAGSRDAFKPNFVSADVRRYELHRVWEVVATVKPGVRHIMPKKVFYLDEDTWSILQGDHYDAQGKLWKVQENGVIPAWEINACTSITQMNSYDLQSHRYVADPVMMGAGKDYNFISEPGSDSRLKSSFFTAETLRSNSER
jgi:hypothetical protein